MAQWTIILLLEKKSKIRSQGRELEKRDKKGGEEKNGKKKRKKGKKKEKKKKVKKFRLQHTLEICYGEENSAKKIKGGGEINQTLVKIYSPVKWLSWLMYKSHKMTSFRVQIPIIKHNFNY